MTISPKPEIWGLVLCGGRSTRMGSDKGLITYHNKPQQEYLFEQLGLVLPHVFISQNKNQVLNKADKTIQDRFAIKSPLNGILSAFEVNSKVAWLVVACDMPYISAHEITKLIHQRNPTKLATCYYGTDDLPHPLFAVYEPAAHTILKEHSKKSISPRKFLIDHDVEIIRLRNVDFLRNVNTPEEFHQLKSELIKRNS